ncbi:transposase DNA-binding-containing protein [Paraburkholderia sp. GAS206C]|uniref:transposase DNA-binding-containing protein n=1 Tax=unclassified Paraburkholderia TaxID=2615204 RepID=UPI003D1E8723
MSGMGQTIPFACQDWAPSRAAYRFLSNDRVSERDILGCHSQAGAHEAVPQAGRREAVGDGCSDEFIRRLVRSRQHR